MMILRVEVPKVAYVPSLLSIWSGVRRSSEARATKRRLFGFGISHMICIYLFKRVLLKKVPPDTER